jgi:SAM-dependent methyltransferase
MSACSYPGTELETFARARRWKAYVGTCMAGALHGDVLEVGAGLGASTRALRGAAQRSWTCLEPDAALASALRRSTGDLAWPVRVVTGTMTDLAAEERFDAIVYLDVLEHIEDDRSELARAASHLAPGGRLVVLSPAHPFLYTPFDRAIGHYRRYTRRSLLAVAPTGMAVATVQYLDCAGALLSLGNRLILRSAFPTAAQIDAWDRWCVPISRRLDPVFAHRLGKSVLVVWRKPGASEARR